MASDPGVTGPAGTLDDPLAESLRLVELAGARGLTLRLMGGMAVRAHAPRWPARTRRGSTRFKRARYCHETSYLRAISCSVSPGWTS